MVDNAGFERAVAREERLRKRASSFETRKGLMRIVMLWTAMLGAGWALLLAGHWLVFTDPRWAAVVHTVVFAVVGGYFVLGWFLSTAFMRAIERRRPDMFEDE